MPGPGGAGRGGDVAGASASGAVLGTGGVPTPEYLRFATHYGFRPDFCEANDPRSKGIVENLVVPLDCTHSMLVSAADCDRLAAAGTPAAGAASAFVRQRIAAHDASQPLATAHAAPVHDAVCVAALVRPQVLTVTGSYHVDVETTGELCIGRTVIDTHRRGGGRPNATVALAGDAAAFVAFLAQTLGMGATED